MYATRQALRDLSPVLAAAVVLTVGQGLLSLLVPLQLLSAGASAGGTTVAMAAFFAGQGLGALLGPRLLGRIGFIRAYLVFTAGLVAVALLHARLDPFLSQALLRMANGYCFAGALVAVEGWLSHQTPSALRGRVLGAYMALYYVALGAGPLSAEASGSTALERFSSAGLVLVAALLPIALTRREAPPAPEVHLLPPSRLADRAPLGMAIAVASGMAMGTFYSVAPVMASEVGLDEAAISRLLGISIVFGLLLQFPVGRLSDAWDRRGTVALVAAGLAVVSLLAMLLLPLWPGALWLACSAYAALAATLYPLAMTHVADWVEPEELGAASGTVVLLNAIGAVLGPLAASPLFGVVGASAGFLPGLVAAVLLALYARHRREVRAPATEPGAFLPLPRTTPVVADLERWDEDPLLQQ